MFQDGETILYNTVIVDNNTVHLSKSNELGFPGGAVVESLPANAGDMGSDPGLGRSHMRRSN